MLLRKARLILLSLTVMTTTYACSAAVTPPNSAEASPAIYQASSGFSSTQGANQWHYQYWDGTAYTNYPTYNSANNRWEVAGTFSNVYPNAHHPDSGKDSVRKWVAPAAGVVRISGVVKKSDITGGDGINAKILHNATTIYDQDVAYNDNVGYKTDAVRTVASGDAIYFRVNMKATNLNDGTLWDPKIEFTPTTKAWEFTSGTEGWTGWNYTLSASGGNLNASLSASDPNITSPDNLGLRIDKSCLVKIRYRNSTSDTSGRVYFTTVNDTVWNQTKSKGFTINANDSNQTEYTVDMCGTYGWHDTLKQLRIDLNDGNASTGSHSVDYIRIEAGGNQPAFTISDRELVYDATQRSSKGLNYWADGQTGVIKTGRDSYDFYSGNGTGSPANARTVKSSGSLSDPAATVHYTTKSITGIPSDFPYVSINMIYKVPATGNLLGFLHMERWPAAGAAGFDGAIGLAISKDNGDSWTYCGEIVSHDRPFSMDDISGHEIGSGSYVIVNDGGTDYFYVYAFDFYESTGLQGISVSRASVASVVSAAEAATPGVTAWNKYYNGGWTEPALGGTFSDAVPGNDGGMVTITYNNHINKYILLATTTRQWETNWADFVIRFSTDPKLFSSAGEQVIEAGTDYVVYPNLIGLGENPQTTSDRSFYLLYMQTQGASFWDSDTNMYRRLITLD
ncbi:hypothetical protein [Paenibacillus sp. GCM10027626]|uniref:hypothetical protein n=1 Tax=Paenibacillus sp. GCM10027626 TaxID=3273411 RepID=UPI003632311A